MLGDMLRDMWRYKTELLVVASLGLGVVNVYYFHGSLDATIVGILVAIFLKMSEGGHARR